MKRSGCFTIPLERTLDGSTYVLVSQTYGGQRSAEQYAALERMIRDEFGNAVVKKEDACYLFRRIRGFASHRSVDGAVEPTPITSMG